MPLGSLRSVGVVSVGVGDFLSQAHNPIIQADARSKDSILFILKILLTSFAVGTVAMGFHLQLLAFNADGGAWGHGLGDKSRCSNDTAPTDDRLAA